MRQQINTATYHKFLIGLVVKVEVSLTKNRNSERFTPQFTTLLVLVKSFISALSQRCSNRCVGNKTHYEREDAPLHRCEPTNCALQLVTERCTSFFLFLLTYLCVYSLFYIQVGTLIASKIEVLHPAVQFEKKK